MTRRCAGGPHREESFDEVSFFGAIDRERLRVLLLGRRALVALGAPVLTQDYDLWVSLDDTAVLNRIASRFDFEPNRAPEEARKTGRYVLEGSERIDVLVARSVSTVDGVRVQFEDMWQRRKELWLDDDVRVYLPSIDDLILTKRFAARAKDIEDIRFLELLRRGLS